MSLGRGVYAKEKCSCQNSFVQSYEQISNLSHPVSAFTLQATSKLEGQDQHCLKIEQTEQIYFNRRTEHLTLRKWKMPSWNLMYETVPGPLSNLFLTTVVDKKMQTLCPSNSKGVGGLALFALSPFPVLAQWKNSTVCFLIEQHSTHEQQRRVVKPWIPAHES